MLNSQLSPLLIKRWDRLLNLRFTREDAFRVGRGHPCGDRRWGGDGMWTLRGKIATKRDSRGQTPVSPNVLTCAQAKRARKEDPPNSREIPTCLVCTPGGGLGSTPRLTCSISTRPALFSLCSLHSLPGLWWPFHRGRLRGWEKQIFTSQFTAVTKLQL